MKDEIDYSQYHSSNLESYLFNTVHLRFVEQGSLSAFDFFCIVIWKAERAKSKIAKRIREHRSDGDLEAAVRQLTREIADQSTDKERLRCLIVNWKIPLPTASAILTVLYPNEFTVYDKRVCEVLGQFHNLANLTFERLWVGYEDYKRAVEESEPKGLTIREKDRYLWGKSFHGQLVKDIAQGFKKTSNTNKPSLLDKYLELPTDELEWKLG